MVIGTGKLAELEVVHLVSTWDTKLVVLYRLIMLIALTLD